VHRRLRDTVVAGHCAQAECLATIADEHKKHGAVLDPHTAVGVAVARRFAEKGTSMLVCGTVS
jgi:threonine synthase